MKKKIILQVPIIVSLFLILLSCESRYKAQKYPASATTLIHDGYTIIKFTSPYEIIRRNHVPKTDFFDIDHDHIPDFAFNTYYTHSASEQYTIKIEVEAVNKKFQIASVIEKDTLFLCTYTFEGKTDYYYYNDKNNISYNKMNQCKGDESMVEENLIHYAQYFKNKDSFFNEVLWSNAKLLLAYEDFKFKFPDPGFNETYIIRDKWLDKEPAYLFFKNDNKQGWFKLHLNNYGTIFIHEIAYQNA